MAASDPGRPPLTILLLGATGLIGAEIARGLLVDGHRVVGVARSVTIGARRMPEVEWRRTDIATLTRAGDWSDLLEGADLAVNAAGALQDGPADDTRAVQVEAPAALFRACAARQLPLIQISAAGTDRAAAPFMRQKAEAEALLKDMDFPWVILRPGLVLSPVAFGGSGMLRALASMPFAIPACYTARPLRCVSAADIAGAVRIVTDGGVSYGRAYDLVSAKAETFADLLIELRAWLGLPPAPVLDLPPALVRPFFALGDAAGYLGWRTPMRSATIDQLASGIDGDPQPWHSVTGRRLPGVRAILSGMPAGVQERWFARLWLLKPVALATLSLFWLLSGILGLLRLDAAAEVLAGRGMGVGLAVAAVVAGSFVDLLIGIAIAMRRTARVGLLAALAVSAAYLAGSALFAPDLWIDPLGPMLKVLPSLVLSLVALATLEER